MNLRNRDLKEVTGLVSQELKSMIHSEPDSENKALQLRMSGIHLPTEGGIVLNTSAKIDVKDAIAFSNLFRK